MKKLKPEIQDLWTRTQQLADKYLEEVFVIVLSYINNFDNLTHTKWNKGAEEILNEFYKSFEEIYSITKTSMKNIYGKENIPDFSIKDIEDLTYQDDEKTIESRIKQYWEEIYQGLKKEIININDLKEYSYYVYSRIMNTDSAYVRTKVMKLSQPINAGMITIDSGECGGECPGGTYPIGEEPDLPPFHVNCCCGWQYEITDDPQEIEDLDLEEDT